jgi:oligopeptide transport system substrate-binding protein
MRYALLLMIMTSTAHASGWVLNNPYPAADSKKNIYYTSFTEQPKTLDPAKSYDAAEQQFIGQIYEPVLQYDYLARPYRLVPLTASQMPEVHYYDALGHEVTQEAPTRIARSVYRIQIKPGILYQPHPALNPTRELVADDYIYQIKRLANPSINSAIYGLMSQYILGFKAFGAQLPASGWVDLRAYPLEGVKKIDKYTYEITLRGQYTQFIYWLGMTFFSPIPWEVDAFYAKPGMRDKSMGFDWYPVGTGAFMMTENNPNRQIILDKNPHYRPEYFPIQGSLDDEKKGYLHHAGQRLPLIDRAIYTLEKESIPRWSKFLQGYYDLSGVSSDSFDEAIHINANGMPSLTPLMQSRGMRLRTAVDPTIYYLGFNMLDSVVGGASARARLLRQAISIAINYDENIAIFLNGRGKTAFGPIPPGMFGFHEGALGINPYVYRWDGRAAKRRPLSDAKALMKQAGFPGGINPKTHQPLMLHYDLASSGGPDDKAELDWMRKQLARIGIALDIRATSYNQFQEKMRNGNAQFFKWGWNADYPDPENFLFLLYGANGQVRHGGENAANYANKTYDRLFNLMKNRNNDAKRMQLIDKMVAIVRHDAPWVWGVHSETLVLSQQWVSPTKPNAMAGNTLKYVGIDAKKRAALRSAWNAPIFWPIALFFLLCLLLLLPFVWSYYKKQQRHAPRDTG